MRQSFLSRQWSILMYVLTFFLSFGRDAETHKYGVDVEEGYVNYFIASCEAST
jgi:hypothetical protein